MPIVPFASAALDCAVNLDGAELWRIADRRDREWLWNGDPAWWSGRAPILFPIIGMLRDGAYRLGATRFAMDKHGFARQRAFALVDQGKDFAALRLDADDETRAIYPFVFRVDLRFSVSDSVVSITAAVSNRGDRSMPFSFGFHPALRWPLPGGAREGATLIFDGAAPSPIYRLDRDGLQDRTEPSCAVGRTIRLEDKLFADDAMVFRDVASRAVTFDCGGAAARVEWDDLPDLGIWTKPGAPYLCIEPWQGFSDPVGFKGELGDKPGTVTLAPGETWHAAMRIAIGG